MNESIYFLLYCTKKHTNVDLLCVLDDLCLNKRCICVVMANNIVYVWCLCVVRFASGSLREDNMHIKKEKKIGKITKGDPLMTDWSN